MVRETLDKLKLEYEKIDVPWPHHQRAEVHAVSGQHTVPVLVDGEVVLDDEDEIIRYLKKTYSANKKVKPAQG
jgi:glutathione S-transferase